MSPTGNRLVKLYRRAIAPALVALAAMGLSPLRAESPAKDWIFDKGRYSDDGATGQRVLQYAPIKPVRRIPYSEYFSANDPHPFGFYPYYFHAPYLCYPYPYYAPDPLFNEMDPLFNGSF